MLRFLRRIKQNSDDGEHSGRFWTFAIGEFILVFLGILIALQVDNWNQNHQERKLEKVILSEMLANLQSDLKDVDFNLSYLSQVLESNQIVLAYLEGTEPWHDSLETHFGHLNGGITFSENISAYESIKSIGIALIRNDSLRQKTTYLYSVQYDYILTFEQISHKYILESLNPGISEHLYTVDFFDRAIPLNPAAIKESNSFRHLITLNIVFLQYQLRSYGDAKKLIVELIKDIEKELS